MKQRYKIGDKVRVRKDLSYCQKYGHVTALNPMVRLAGQVVTIADTDGGCYYVREDSFGMYFSEEMFDDIPELNPFI